jgi:hypothetical protein
MKKKNEIIYLVYYIIAMIFVLVIHYFLISKLKVNSTIQVLIDLIIFLFSLAVMSGIRR